MQEQARIFVKFDEQLNILIIELSKDVAFEYMKMIRQHLWPEVEHMKMEIVDVVSESGKEYKGVMRYLIPVYKDRVDCLFEAAKAALSSSIKKSIPNSDN